MEGLWGWQEWILLSYEINEINLEDDNMLFYQVDAVEEN